MKEIIESEKWEVIPGRQVNPLLSGGHIELTFRLKSDPKTVNIIKPEDLEELEKDIEDLGKWRIYKKLKEELNN